jgi:hypothetical protein
MSLASIPTIALSAFSSASSFWNWPGITPITLAVPSYASGLPLRSRMLPRRTVCTMKSTQPSPSWLKISDGDQSTCHSGPSRTRWIVLVWEKSPTVPVV